MNASVVDFGQPPARHLAQMFQRPKGATVEQIFFYIVEWPFDLTFGFGAPGLASPRLEAIVCGEGQEASIVDRLAVFPASDHDFHVVVEAYRGHASQMFEGGDMLTHRRFKVLPLGEADVLPPRVSEDIAEQFHAATPFLFEVERVTRPVHLSLSARRSFEADRRCFRLRSVVSEIDANGRVTARKAQLAKLFECPLGRELGVAVKQRLELIRERIELGFSGETNFAEAGRKRRWVGRLSLREMLPNNTRDHMPPEL